MGEIDDAIESAVDFGGVVDGTRIRKWLGEREGAERSSLDESSRACEEESGGED